MSLTYLEVDALNSPRSTADILYDPQEGDLFAYSNLLGRLLDDDGHTISQRAIDVCRDLAKKRGLRLTQADTEYAKFVKDSE